MAKARPVTAIRKRAWITPGGETKTAWLVDYRDSGGKRRAKQFSRKKDAEAWSTQAAWHVSQGTHTPDAASITVSRACDLWLEKSRAEGLEESTLRGYEQRVRLHIKPNLASEKLSRLTRPQVEVFADLMVQTRGKALATMVMRALSSAIGDAQRRGLVAQNVAQGVRIKRPKRDRERIVIPSKAELQALLKTADDRERPIVMTAIYSGLRASELRGLVWPNVDLKKGRIEVTQRADAWNQIGPPKSAAARRSVPIPPSLVAELRRWKLACPAGALNLVFPNTAGNVQSLPNILQRMFSPLQIRAGLADPKIVRGVPALDKAGLPAMTSRYGMHSLRHAAASLWIEHRVDPKRVQSWIGHASIQLTFDTYGHLFEAADSDAVVAMAIEQELAG